EEKHFHWCCICKSSEERVVTLFIIARWYCAQVVFSVRLGVGDAKVSEANVVYVERNSGSVEASDTVGYSFSVSYGTIWTDRNMIMKELRYPAQVYT
ncbi:unnamed protein product, partial [Ilex paraguariensis]